MKREINRSLVRYKVFGLDFDKRTWYFGYLGMERGFVIESLLPDFIRDAFVFGWNRIICYFWGHHRILEKFPETWEKNGTFHCIMCCKILTPRM